MGYLEDGDFLPDVKHPVTVHWYVVCAIVGGSLAFLVGMSVCVYRCVRQRQASSTTHRLSSAIKKGLKESAGASVKSPDQAGTMKATHGTGPSTPLLHGQNKPTTIGEKRAGLSPTGNGTNAGQPRTECTVEDETKKADDKVQSPSEKDERMREKAEDELKMTKLGSLYFQVEYDKQKTALVVTVVRATDLPAKDPNLGSSDPYIKLQLLPEKRHKVKTRVLRKFKGLFPAEMEPEVARYASYEKYDDGRIIAYQGRTPDRFYYVIAGRVAILRQYKLSTGQVTKAMGFLTKGMTTDAEEMEKQWMREDSLICRGQVEVLILDRKAFNFLQHTTQGPPIEFLRSLDLFEDFPVEEFLAHPDAIDYKFYGQGKSIVKDSNRTPWILVVKSGQVKVVRYQSVIDARTSNESKFNTPRIEELGCTRAASHADAMLGVQAKQKKIKESLELPRIYRNRNSANTSRVSKPVLCDVEHDDDGDYLEADNTSSEYQSPVDDKDRDRQLTSALPSSATITPSSSGKRKATFPSIDSAKTDNGTKASSEDQFQPHSLWLTRERTEADPSLPPLGPSALGTFTPRQRKEVQHRRAYLQLDVLNPGDVFGLDHLQPALASEGRGFSLMSDGAEVIMISKRFFLQHADNNTMLKVDTMYKEYISEDEATSALYEQETWDQYKAALWKIMSAPFPAIR